MPRRIAPSSNRRSPAASTIAKSSTSRVKSGEQKKPQARTRAADAFVRTASTSTVRRVKHRDAEPGSLKRVQTRIDKQGLRPSAEILVASLPDAVQDAVNAFGPSSTELTAYRFTDGATKYYAVLRESDDGSVSVRLFDGAGAPLSEGTRSGSNGPFTWQNGRTNIAWGHGQDIYNDGEPTLVAVDGEVPKFTADTKPLFSNGAQYDDVTQGEIGDCFFLSSLSAMTLRHPELTRNNITHNADGTYSVKFFKEVAGQPKAVVVTVKATLPTLDDGSGPKRSYGTAPDDRESWVGLYEKAYATFVKGYDVLNEGGDEADAMYALTGVKAESLDVDFTDRQALFDRLKQAVADGRMVTSGTWAQAKVRGHLRAVARTGFKDYDPKTFSYEDAKMVEGHAYTVVDVQQKNGKKLVTLRNPWGQTEPGSDGTDDGVFTLTLDQFAALYHDVTIGK